MALSDVVVDGPLLLAAPLAVAAGLVSFLSPCSLPLVPGYLSYVGGLSASEVSREGTAHPSGLSVTTGPLLTAAPRSGRRRVIAGACLFVLGFSAVFTAYGAAAGAFGGLLFDQSRAITTVLGAATVLLGLVFAGILSVPALGRTVKPGALPAAGLAGAPLLGALFAVGWTPCIGPTLAAVLSLSADSATVQRGALLAFLYSAGLGLPFIGVAVSMHQAMDRLAPIRRHSTAIMRTGGVLLILIGLLQISGVWGDWLNALRAWVGAYGTIL